MSDIDVAAPDDPPWLDRYEYPFESHYYDAGPGRMHYVDEGEGDPVVMLHGNPTWSFLYRDVIRGLSDSYRCIAPDYVGFGLSDKPTEWSYLPRDHAATVADLLAHLDLDDVTLVMQDYGGPIGTSWAVDHPERVRALVPMNTWAWPLDGNLRARLFSATVGGRVGKALIDRYNFFATGVMRMAFGSRRWLPDVLRRELPERIHRQYTEPLSDPDERKGTWVFPHELTGSRDWFDDIWSAIDRISGRPLLAIWGLNDPAFREQDMVRWLDAFPEHDSVTFQDAGHYLQEQKGPAIAEAIDGFLAEH